MEQLYSIGQVSKLKGVSPRMLRYYDKLGILVPRSVDDETGYRRYTLDQMVELDVIRMCIDAGIPLAELAVMQEQQPARAAAYLLEEARAQLTARIGALERTRLSIDDYLAELGDERAMPRDNATGTLPSGMAVALPWKRGRFDGRAYLRSMTQLEEACRRRGLAPFLKRGVAFDVARQQAWAFIEVAPAEGLWDEPESQSAAEGADAGRPVPAVLALPEGRFEGSAIEGGGVTEAFEKGFAAALALVDAPPPTLRAASITLTERWGAGLERGPSAVLLRAHEQGIGVAREAE